MLFLTGIISFSKRCVSSNEWYFLVNEAFREFVETKKPVPENGLPAQGCCHQTVRISISSFVFDGLYFTFIMLPARRPERLAVPEG
jgi:hypothetical protein